MRFFQAILGIDDTILILNYILYFEGFYSIYISVYRSRVYWGLALGLGHWGFVIFPC